MNTKQKLQKIAELANDLANTYDTVNFGIFNSPNDGIDNASRAVLRGKIDEWATKIAGVSLGYYAEFNQMKKHAIDKKRVISNKRADVLIGNDGEYFAKAVQCKSTTQSAANSVTSMMKEALNQLAGERGEQPRDGDRRIVDMTIMNPDNVWPFDRFLFEPPTLDQYSAEAIKILKQIMSSQSYQQHNSQRKALAGKNKGKLITVDGEGIDDISRNWMKNFQRGMFDSGTTVDNYGMRLRNKSTLPVYEDNGTLYKAMAFTFKIRHGFGFQLKDRGVLKTAVFHAMRSNGVVDVKLAKADTGVGQARRVTSWTQTW